MRKRDFFLPLFILHFVFCISAQAQEYLFPLNRDMETRMEPYLNPDSGNFHTALKPFTYAEARDIAPVDSVFAPIGRNKKFSQTLVGRKLFKEHLIDINKDDLHLSIDPVFNFEGGKDQASGSTGTPYTNTRGVLVQGDVKQKFFFYSGFTENRVRYVNYMSSFVYFSHVAPGQGRVKEVGASTFDFSNAKGGIGYTLDKHFDFMLAHDKIFIGDGYRSLLLSDNAYNYPFLRLNMKFWKFKYTAIYAAMVDGVTFYDINTSFQRKFARINYLDLNIGKKNRVSIGIFEAVISKPDPNRPFDFNYVNPVIFLRPVEYSVGSPDNELLGANVKIKINPNNILYGQLMLDEFVLSQVKSGKGWWGNKQGLQGGFKCFNIFKVKNLNVQSEINFVRPYTYQHHSNGTSYSYYNQPLAHPFGANFIESVSFINYRWRNFFVEAKLLASVIGKDFVDVTGFHNVGNSVYNDYSFHGAEYGHKVLDGDRVTLVYNEFRINYLVNPKTNLNIELGIRSRTYKEHDFDYSTSSRFVYLGLRTSLENLYFDF
jgi:hypothetical protein